MKIVFSTLENNVFSEILVKKGDNLINNTSFKKLKADKAFCKAAKNGYIFVSDDCDNAPVNDISKEKLNKTADFDSMSYQDLVKYAKENNIEAPSKSKADILQAIKENM